MWDWKAGCTALIRSVDPHAKDRPVYLLERQEARSIADPCDLDAVGFTSIAFSERFRAFLEDRGEWRGRGFVAVIDTEPMSRIQIEGVVLHEYAHDVIDRGIVERIRNGDIRDPSTIAGLLHIADPAKPMKPATDDLYDDAWRPWHHHGPDFMRICIHIADRAVKRCGWFGDVAVVWDCQGGSRGLLSPMAYAQQLGIEPQRLADIPLAAVVSITPPIEFKRFADRDLNEAEQRFRSPGDEGPPPFGSSRRGGRGAQSPFSREKGAHEVKKTASFLPSKPRNP